MFNQIQPQRYTLNSFRRASARGPHEESFPHCVILVVYILFLVTMKLAILAVLVS